MESVARTAADGYTLLFESNAEFSVLPALLQKIFFDPVEDFASLAMLAELPVVYVVVRPSAPATNINQPVEYARKSPNAMH